MTIRHVPSDCKRRTSADLADRVTGSLLGPVPLNDHSVVTNVRSLT